MLPLAFRMVRPTLTFAVFGAVLCASVAPAAAQDFQKDVVPFLEKYCYDCHDAELEKGHLNLEAFKDDSRFFRDQRVWREVVNQVTSGEMPPAKKKTRPSPAEVEALQSSVHKLLAAAIAKAKPDPGDVTIRRLNRAEYNQTIRDLCFLDENFSADFPADDTGYGFDNIGDVLTFSPVHLERFLSVGEAIAAKAMPDKAGEMEGTGLAMVEMSPKGRRESQQRFFDPAPTLTGPMTATRDGDYVISVSLRSTGSAGDPPPKVAFLVDGREVGAYQFKQVKKSEVAEAKVTLTAGPHDFTLKWLNPPAKITGNARTLSGLRLRLLGPKDTRTELQRRLALVIGTKFGTARAQAVANSFVSRAFRRPATPAELNRYVKVFLDAEKAKGSWEAGAQAMIALVLASPKFIFRAEQDETPTAKDAHPISEFALASRLSYFLWGSMPDDELFQLAYAKKLSANLEAQTRRLLKDPRSRYLTEGFGLQWLQLRQLSAVSPDPAMFPAFNDAVRASMIKETELFFAEIVREDRSVLDLIDADFTWLNPRLAEHYGLSELLDPNVREGFQRVALPQGGRLGALTQGAWLTLTSHPTRTSPVVRGKWVLENLLCVPPPPPPPGVEGLPPAVNQDTSVRARLEQHRADPACAACHVHMDSIGFGLERFDGVGAFRVSDAGRLIETAGLLPPTSHLDDEGAPFEDAVSMARALRDDPRVGRCVAERFLVYALGRGLQEDERCFVDEVINQAEARGMTLRALVEATALSPLLLTRGEVRP